MIVKNIIFFIHIYGYVYGATNSALDFEVPQEFTLDTYKPDKIPQVVEWKERCRKLAGEEALKEIESAPEYMTQCLLKYINVEKMKKELTLSFERGMLDAMFKKYCKRKDKYYGCFSEVLDKFNPCMKDNEMYQNITRSVLNVTIDFLCHDGGSRIALFMSENGKDCVTDHQEEIKDCAKEMPELKSVLTSPASAVNLSMADPFSNKNCKKLHSAHHCIVEVLKKCDDTTPANMIGSLIVEILKVTPCQLTSTASGLTSLASRFLTLVGAALMAAHILL